MCYVCLFCSSYPAIIFKLPGRHGRADAFSSLNMSEQLLAELPWTLHRSVLCCWGQEDWDLYEICGIMLPHALAHTESLPNSSSLPLLPLHTFFMLQHGSSPCPSGTVRSSIAPPWSTVLLEKLLLYGFLSMVHSSWQESAPAWAGTCAAVWISAPLWVLQKLQGHHCLSSWSN